MVSKFAIPVDVCREYSALSSSARLHVITAIVSVVLFLLIGYKIFSSIQTGGSVHTALLIMAITALCDGFSSIFELVHLATYENNGIGSYSLDALSAHFEAMSDSLVALVLLSVGSGWTLPSDVLLSLIHISEPTRP